MRSLEEILSPTNRSDSLNRTVRRVSRLKHGLYSVARLLILLAIGYIILYPLFYMDRVLHQYARRFPRSGADLAA